MTHIALVDDDENIQTSVAMALKAQGYQVSSYGDGMAALEGVATHPPDLMVLDIKMPRLDGLETLKRLRQSTDLPVIMLTSKDEEIDQILGFNLGADDYVTKPFSQRLLIERVRAVLRRANPETSGADTKTPESTLVRGKLHLNAERHTCQWDGQEVRLTVTEFLILEALASRPGYVKSRDQLMDVAYSDGVYVDDRTIDSHVKRLRKKFRQLDKSFNAIETLYGVGYRYKADADAPVG